jgi:RNA polymerase II subunit A C-terminal domain phosphatase
VRQAARHPKVKIVTIEWLHKAFLDWQKPDEGPYIVPVEPDEDGPLPTDLGSVFDDLDNGIGLFSSDEEAAATEDEKDGLEAVEVEEDLEGVMPISPSDDRTLIGGTDQDWESMGAELDEFLAESDSDESVQSDTTGPAGNKKRKRANDSEPATESEESDSGDKKIPSSQLQQRKKRALQRVSSLTNVESLNGKTPSSLPSPESTNPSDDQEPAVDGVRSANDYDDDDDDAALEAEMEAELAKESQEDDG